MDTCRVHWCDRGKERDGVQVICVKNDRNDFFNITVKVDENVLN